jgi:hypothetical protein
MHYVRNVFTSMLTEPADSKRLQLSVSVSTETVFHNQLASKNQSLNDTHLPVPFLEMAHTLQYITSFPKIQCLNSGNVFTFMLCWKFEICEHSS